MQVRFTHKEGTKTHTVLPSEDNVYAATGSDTSDVNIFPAGPEDQDSVGFSHPVRSLHRCIEHRMPDIK